MLSRTPLLGKKKTYQKRKKSLPEVERERNAGAMASSDSNQSAESFKYARKPETDPVCDSGIYCYGNGKEGAGKLCVVKRTLTQWMREE